MNSPTHPKIYHITHYSNLARIMADGCLWSDAEIMKETKSLCESSPGYEPYGEWRAKVAKRMTPFAAGP